MKIGTLVLPDTTSALRNSMRIVKVVGWVGILCGISCTNDKASGNEAKPSASASASATVTAKPSASDASVNAAPMADASHAAASAPTDAAAPSSTGASGAVNGRYPWSPVIVQVPGKLVRKQLEYSGGLNVPVVVFDPPIRMQERPGMGSRGLVREAWLSYNGISKDEVNKLIGKKVLYKGELNPMQTAHHMSDPWLDGTVVAR